MPNLRRSESRRGFLLVDAFFFRLELETFLRFAIVTFLLLPRREDFTFTGDGIGWQLQIAAADYSRRAPYLPALGNDPLIVFDPY